MIVSRKTLENHWFSRVWWRQQDSMCIFAPSGAKNKVTTSVCTGGSNTPPGCCTAIGSSPLSFSTKKKPVLLDGFLFGGDNRTRTCDLMRVKQPRDFRPVWEEQFSTKTLENTGLFGGLPWQAAFLFCGFDLMPSATKSIAHQLFRIQALCLKLYTSFYISPYHHISRNNFPHLLITTNNPVSRRSKKNFKISIKKK